METNSCLLFKILRTLAWHIFHMTWHDMTNIWDENISILSGQDRFLPPSVLAAQTVHGGPLGEGFEVVFNGGVSVVKQKPVLRNWWKKCQAKISLCLKNVKKGWSKEIVQNFVQLLWDVHHRSLVMNTQDFLLDSNQGFKV